MWPKVREFIDFIFSIDGYHYFTHHQLSSFLEESKHTIRYLQSEKQRLIVEQEVIKSKENDYINEIKNLQSQIQDQQVKIHNLNRRFHKKLTLRERLTGRLK